MKPLVDQPSAAPSRKWWAGALAAVLVNGAFGFLDAVWPDHPFAPYKADLIGWAVAGIMLASQYLTRNRAP